MEKNQVAFEDGGSAKIELHPSRGQPIYGHLQQMSQIGRTDQAERARKMRWFVLARKSVDIFCQQYIFDLYFPAIQPLQIQIHVVYI